MTRMSQRLLFIAFEKPHKARKTTARVTVAWATVLVAFFFQKQVFLGFRNEESRAVLDASLVPFPVVDAVLVSYILAQLLPLHLLFRVLFLPLGIFLLQFFFGPVKVQFCQCLKVYLLRNSRHQVFGCERGHLLDPKGRDTSGQSVPSILQNRRADDCMQTN